MTESEVNALLDAHDALVRACVDASLTLPEFLGAYGEFPQAYALDERKASGDELAVLRRFRKRIAFHSRVSDVLSGPSAEDAYADMGGDEIGAFFPMVKLVRLRQLVARYPDLKTEPENAGDGAR
jgi:hypothetical protein